MDDAHIRKSPQLITMGPIPSYLQHPAFSFSAPIHEFFESGDDDGVVVAHSQQEV
jgi:hypothetical protein